MWWAEHVASIGDMRSAYTILVRKHEERHHTKDLGVGGKITLEWILRKVWSGFIWLKIA